MPENGGQSQTLFVDRLFLNSESSGESEMNNWIPALAPDTDPTFAGMTKKKSAARNGQRSLIAS